MNKTFTCPICRHRRRISRRREVDGQAVCSHCFTSGTKPCSHCGELHLLKNICTFSGHDLCKWCFDEHYAQCKGCGALIDKEETILDHGERFCTECFEKYYSEHGSVEAYSYKPIPNFLGTDSRYYGVELEIDGGGETDARAAKIMFEANGGNNRYVNRVYCKHDGSLDDGFEIVTHPMTLDYQCTTMPWDDVLAAAQEMGYTSHVAETCGLHIHVNRSSLCHGQTDRASAIGRILYFVERHWDELVTFSRRTLQQLKDFAERYGYKDSPQELYEYAASGGRGNSRYTCVNLTNEETIEFRIFRGTLKRTTLVASLQLVHAICDLAVFSTDEEITCLSWPEFVAQLSAEKTPELVRYLKERRLYVNDIIEVEAEI